MTIFSQSIPSRGLLPQLNKGRLYLPVMIGLICGLVLTVLAKDMIQRQVDRDAAQELQQRTDVIAAGITGRMQTYGNALMQMRGLIALMPALDQKSLEAYIAQIELMNHYPGLRGIGFARRVSAAEIPAHVAGMRQQGMPNYQVYPEVVDGDAFPVVLLAPVDQAGRAIFGFDMYSEKIRHDGMLAAAASGATQLSGTVRLKATAEMQPALGCMLYVPVYRPGAKVDTLAARLNAVTGIFYAPFRMQDLFNGIFGNSTTTDHEVSFQVYDADGEGVEALIYDREQAIGRAPQTGVGAALKREVTIAGHTWRLVVTPLPGLYHGLATRLPLFVFLAGLTVSLLLTRVLYGYAAQSQRDRQGRRRAEAATARARLLAQCGTILNSSVQGQSHVQRVAELVVEELAEVCLVHLAAPSGDLELRFVGKRSVAAAKSGERRRRRHRLLRLDAGRGARLLALLPELWSGVEAPSAFFAQISRLLDLPAAASPFATTSAFRSPSSLLVNAMPPLLAKAEVGSYIAVPLTVRGRSHGVMTFIRSSNKAVFSQGDLAYSEEVAGRVAVALDNAQLYVEIHDAKEQAEAANRAKSTFLANISHEIRTPLGAVLGFADMLQEPQLDGAERAAFTSTIVRNAQELSRLIDDLLDLSKIEAGRLDIECLPVRLGDVLTDIRISLGLRARDKGIVLDVQIDPDVPEYVLTDPTRLRQILLNLIGNALKFTSSGRVEVQVGHRGSGATAVDGETPSQVVFRITDTGPGIAHESQAALFQPFTQADASTTRRYGGTGLGLVLSRMLARALGGDVELAYSEPGRGSVFVVTIDGRSARAAKAVHHVPPLAPWSTAASSSKEKDEAPRPQPLCGLRLLLAEDLPDNQLLITRLLKSAGAAVDVVDNGLAAVETGSEHSYDLILMDLQMPLLDGFGATAELRRRGVATPIVALTAHALREERDKCLTAGCDDHLTKPVNPQILVRTVAYFCAKGRPADRSQRPSVPHAAPV